MTTKKGSSSPEKEKLEVIEDDSGSSATERTQLALDMREVQRLDSSLFRGKENAPLFESLNLAESAEKQKAKLTEFVGTLVFELIPFLLYKEIPVEKIRNRAVFGDSIDLTVGNPQGVMDLRCAFNKMSGIGSSDLLPDSVGMSILDNWNGIVDKAVEVARVTTPVFNGEKSPTEAIDDDKDGFFDKWGRPILIGAVTFGLVWGATKLVRKLWNSVSGVKGDEKKETPKEGKSDVVKTILTGFGGFALVIGLFAGLGRLAKTETVKEWLRDLGLDDSRMVEGFRLVWDVITGKTTLSEAWEKFKELLDDKPVDSAYVKIADYVNNKVSGASVSGESIQKISDIKFRDWFPSTIGEYVSKEAGDAVRAGIESVASDMPFIGIFAKENPKLKEDMEIIEKFIQLPENQEKLEAINPGPKMTMREVLERLCELPIEHTEPKLPDAEAVVPAGPTGAVARKEAREKHGKIKENQGLVLSDIPANIEVVSDDIDDFIELTEEADKSMMNWWQREKEYFRKVLSVVPSKGYEEADYIQLVNELTDAQDTDIIIIQDLRSQASALKQKIDGLEKPISEEKLNELKGEIDDFYTNYYQFQAKLDEVNQRRIREQEEREREDIDAKWVVDEGLCVAQLALNTFWGMPYSVALREENGVIVATLGLAQGGLFVFGIGKGLLQGKGVVGAAGEGLTMSVKPVTATMKYGTVYGFRVSRKAVEAFEFMETSAGLLRVQNGMMSVDDAIRNMEAYLDHYDLVYRDNGIVADPATRPTLKKRILNSWRNKSITSEERKILEENLKILHALRKAGCRTWQQGVDKGIAPTARSVAEVFRGSYTAREEAMIAETVKALRKNPSLSDELRASEENILRQLAIEKLQAEGKLIPVEEMGRSIREALNLPETVSHSERIVALKEASVQADLYFEKSIARVKQMRTNGVPEEQIEVFVKEVQANLKALRENYGKNLAALQSMKGSMTRADKKALASFLREGAANAKGIRGILRETKVRGKYAVVFGVANIVLETYLLTKDQKDEYVREELVDMAKLVGLDTLEIVIDVLCPFGVTDWITVFRGKTYLTQREISGWERATRVVFGTYSAAADTLALLGAGATAEAGGAGGGVVYGAENAIEGALRVAGKAPRLISVVKTLLPRLMALGRDVGGFKNLFTILRQEKTLQAIRGVQKVKSVSSTAMKGVLAVEVGRMAYAGYEIAFDTKDQPTYEFDLEDEQLE